MENNVTLLAPAGNFESLAAALKNGADAVYFGVGNLNMRAHASLNFREEDLPEIVARCRESGAEPILAVNTIIYDSELDEVRNLCRTAKESGIGAVIASDIAVMQIARSFGLSVHLSVQANICNMESVRFFARFADVMVLARELDLAGIAAICKAIREESVTGPSGNLVKIEIFAHGALCVAVSGRCWMSLAEFNSSANRGRCFQSCRRSYTLTDTVNGTSFELDHQYVMAPKDICTLEILDRILKSGVSVLKIEGRGRSSDYTATVTSVYRCALEEYERLGKVEDVSGKMKELRSVFHHGFWENGYYLGSRMDGWTKSGENQAELCKEFVGTVRNFYSRLEVAEIRIEASGLKTGDLLLVTGPTTGAVRIPVGELLLDGRKALSVEKGMLPTLKVSEKVRKNDKIYKIFMKKA